MSVKALTDSTVDLWGLDCDDLQSDIAVGADAITGTLKYIADYSSAFSGDLASGNYIALKIEVPNVEGVTIQAGADNLSTLDEDGIIVIRIADKSSQTVKVVASADGYEDVTKEYDLTGLTTLSE